MYIEEFFIMKNAKVDNNDSYQITNFIKQLKKSQEVNLYKVIYLNKNFYFQYLFDD